MNIEWHLLAHNIGGIIGAIALFGLGIFVLINNPRSRTAIVFSLMVASVEIFLVSHLIGVNIVNPQLSRAVLMFNLSCFPLGIFILHTILAVINKERENRIALISAYVIGSLFIIFFLIFPDQFLLPSVPKLYFPNYYNPGALNWLRVLFLYGLCLPYGVVQLVRAYRKTSEATAHQQLKFFGIAIIIGFGFGAIPNFLVYNINIDPVIGIAIFSLCTIPLIYESVRYGFLNIKVIARQAFFYSLGVIILGGFIVFLNNANVWLAETYPGFPSWIIPLISSVSAITIGIVIWTKLRQGDIMKYEFITTVTHKFRTPLTHIKWASENLAKENLPATILEQIGYIQSANVSLVELTNLLMNVSETESQAYEYKMELGDLTVTAEETIARVENQFKAKNVHVVKNLTKGKFAHYDASRIRFIIQTFLENAVHYSSATPAINIMVVREGNEIRCSVTDNGIGIPKEELSNLFAKFYRGHRARLTDTEGMGIGLFMAKEIIEHHKGRIWAESHGEGLGSTFSFALPAAK